MWTVEAVIVINGFRKHFQAYCYYATGHYPGVPGGTSPGTGNRSEEETEKTVFEPDPSKHLLALLLTFFE